MANWDSKSNQQRRLCPAGIRLTKHRLTLADRRRRRRLCAAAGAHWLAGRSARRRAAAGPMAAAGAGCRRAAAWPNGCSGAGLPPCRERPCCAGGSRHAHVQSEASAQGWRGRAGGAPACLHVPPAQPPPLPLVRRAASTAGRSEGTAGGAGGRGQQAAVWGGALGEPSGRAPRRAGSAFAPGGVCPRGLEEASAAEEPARQGGRCHPLPRAGGGARQRWHLAPPELSVARLRVK